MPNHLFSSLVPPERARGRQCLVASDGRRFTFGEVDQISARYASALASSGVRQGDRVAVQVEKSPEALFLYLGCIRSGAVFLPLNTAYTLPEIEYFIGDSEPALVVGVRRAQRRCRRGEARADADGIRQRTRVGQRQLNEARRVERRDR